MKKIISIALMLLTLGTSIGYANSNDAVITTNDGKEIQNLSGKKVKGIKWNKTFINIIPVDEHKLNEFKKNNHMKESDFHFIDGISGDFISIKQIKEGEINTCFGKLSLIWTNENNKPFLNVCDKDVCSNEVYLKAINSNDGILYGTFNEILKDRKQMLGYQDYQLIGISKIKLKKILGSQPHLDIQNFSYNDSQIHELKYSDVEVWNEEENRFETVGTYKNFNLKFIRNKDKTSQALALEDGTRVYSRMTDDSDIVDLFYLDFDNNTPDKIRIVDIGLVYFNNLIP